MQGWGGEPTKTRLTASSSRNRNACPNTAIAYQPMPTRQVRTFAGLPTDRSWCMQACADFRMSRHRGRKDSAHADISQTQAKDAFLQGQPNNSAMITKGECYREIRPGSRCLGIESTKSKAEVTLLQREGD